MLPGWLWAVGGGREVGGFCSSAWLWAGVRGLTVGVKVSAAVHPRRRKRAGFGRFGRASGPRKLWSLCLWYQRSGNVWRLDRFIWRVVCSYSCVIVAPALLRVALSATVLAVRPHHQLMCHNADPPNIRVESDDRRRNLVPCFENRQSRRWTQCVGTRVWPADLSGNTCFCVCRSLDELWMKGVCFQVRPQRHWQHCGNHSVHRS